jgi:MFS family permease
LSTTSTIEREDPISYRALIQNNRDFRYLWLGQIVSLLGDWFNLIASASLVAELSQSGLAIGGLFVIRMLAQLMATPFAGVAADRYNRKTILVVTDVLRAITVLGFLLVQEPEQVWLLYVLTGIQLAISGFFFPTRNAMLPEVVVPRELGAANALSSATWSVMLALGAALGGLVAGTWGNQPAFIIDALTFVLSALLIMRISYQPSPELLGSDKTVAAAISQYLDGLTYLRKHIDILVVTLHKPLVALIISSGFQVLQVTVAEEVFRVGKGGGISLGLIYGTVGIGTGIGPIIARRFTRDRNQALRVAIIVAYVVAALGLMISSPLQSFPIFLFGALMRGVGVGTVWVFSTQLLLQLVPNRLRGRVFASEWMMFTLMSASGAGITGAIVNAPERIPLVLLTMAILTLVPGLLWTIWLASARAKRYAENESSAADGSQIADGTGGVQIPNDPE